MISLKLTIVVGLSGGVDSAVVTKILVDQGHNVITVFMKNWDDTNDSNCPVAIDAFHARSIANQLGVPFYSFNFSKQYWDDVFSYFLEQHKKYRTPNPDILCNKYIKFKILLEYAQKLGANYLATGHYAKNIWNSTSKKWELKVPIDKNKDQTYFLYTLGQEQLSRVLFPLSDLYKPEIRNIAIQNKFINANKKDSTGICFIGEQDYLKFLQKYLKQKEGNIVTENGQIIGKHCGLSFYTLGQRRNMNIGGVQGYPEKPWFVLNKSIDQNELIVGQDSNHELLMSRELIAKKLHWVSGQPPASKFFALSKIRYRQDFQKCQITAREDGAFLVYFDIPQRAITSGQSIVFYEISSNDENNYVCLGGGEII